MTLNPLQNEAYEALVNRENVRIGGLAGTGKTYTVAEALKALPAARRVGREWDDGAILAAPTNKATNILKAKVPHATVSTLHSLLMQPYEKEKTHYDIHPVGEDLPEGVFQLTDEPEMIEVKLESTNTKADTKQMLKAIAAGTHQAVRCVRSEIAGFRPREDPVDAFVIIDESSMIGSDMYNVISRLIPNHALVGDYGQLPPVKDTQIFTEESLDIVLTEVLRQAAGSPIVQYAHDYRRVGFRCEKQGRHIYPGIPLVTRSSSVYEDLLEPNTVAVVWKNADRHAINTACRRIAGFTAPTANEPIVSYANDKSLGVANSATGTIVDVEQFFPEYQLAIATVDFGGEENIRVGLMTDYMVGQDDNTAAVAKLRSIQRRICVQQDADLLPCQWGYAITAHKAQGSEWEKVYVLDTRKAQWGMHMKTSGGDRDIAEQEVRRWFYTAITRARSELRIML